jgi:hypothetical protein
MNDHVTDVVMQRGTSGCVSGYLGENYLGGDSWRFDGSGGDDVNCGGFYSAYTSVVSDGTFVIEAIYKPYQFINNLFPVYDTGSQPWRMYVYTTYFELKFSNSRTTSCGYNTFTNNWYNATVLCFSWNCRWDYHHLFQCPMSEYRAGFTSKALWCAHGTLVLLVITTAHSISGGLNLETTLRAMGLFVE